MALRLLSVGVSVFPFPSRPEQLGSPSPPDALFQALTACQVQPYFARIIVLRLPLWAATVLQSNSAAFQAGCSTLQAASTATTQAQHWLLEQNATDLFRDAQFSSHLFHIEHLLNILRLPVDAAERDAMEALSLILAHSVRQQLCWDLCRLCFPCWTVTAQVRETCVAMTTGDTGTDTCVHINFDEWSQLVASRPNAAAMLDALDPYT